MTTLYSDGPRHSNTDLQDYYDSVPPPHRLSGMNTPSSFSTQDIPLMPQSPSGHATRSYGAPLASQPSAMESTTDMTTGYRDYDHHGYSDHDHIAPNDNWMEKGASTGSGKKKWVVIGGILGLVALIAIGVALGVTLSKKSSSSSTKSSSSSSDPSSFTKDTNLKQSFYGIAYTPAGSQLPDCGNSLDDVISDIQIMSQLTTRVRLYGADCNQSALVLEAVKQTNVNMTVFLGNYPVSTDNDTAYDRQRDLIKSAIQTYGTDHIGGVTVGNEYILNYLNANAATDPNGAVGNKGGELLIANINDTRSMLSDLGVSLPVGNADAGSYFNDLVLEQVDYGMANVHPWFANVSVDQSAGWTWEFFETNDVQLAQGLSNTPEMYVAETGWPTKSSDTADESNGPSTASVANLQVGEIFDHAVDFDSPTLGLQTFLDTYICEANTNGTKYFFFEFFDEKWKDEQYGGVEGWWGLFNANRTLKDGITIPDCVLS
ncbi:glycoside hydrolase family 17 protein [Armillaria novae-zelandiae]|uniref:glucan endo-1,3-beta-D-glucosidase n=1 Tax=Armillaria novae-zelandiae TaxID=153914 RepID=A0AA39TCJ3_9AGAR|nr:glycoside hydrolase family 17 protein [Armillaria novae-zelandiae]